MRRLSLLLLALTTWLASCTTQAAPDRLFVDQAERAARGRSDGHLIVELDLEHPFLRDHMRLDVWHARPDRTRLEVLESNQLGLIGLVSASSGPQGWRYHPVEHRLDQGPIETVRPAIVYELITTTLAIVLGEEPWNVTSTAPGYLNSKEMVRLTLARETGSCDLWLGRGSMSTEKVECTDRRFGRFRAIVRDARYDLGLTDDLFGPEFLPPAAARVD